MLLSDLAVRTFADIAVMASAMPPELVNELGRIEFGRGREELHRAQAPQVLERLAAQTRFESITASNAIENVVVAPERALALVREPAPVLRDRTEREFAGYKDAMDYLMAKPSEPLDAGLVLHVHRLLMRHIDDPLAGRFKAEDNLIGDRRPDGSVSVVFRPAPAGRQTEWHITELLDRYEETLGSGRIHPLVLTAALVLDLLAIHPFRDGNGRVARLITTNELLRHGYGIARYISLEQRIFEARNSYYDALAAAQRGWHDSAHDIWPWAGFLLRLLADAYEDFEARVVGARSLQGATKTEQACDYILNHAPETFSFAQIAAALPDISAPTIRNALNRLRAEGRVSVGRGRSAQWSRLPAPSPEAPLSVPRVSTLIE